MTMTKKEMYTNIQEYVMNPEQFEKEGFKESLVTDIIDFCNHEIELLEKKSVKKVPTKKQIANDEMKKKIVDILSTINKPITITELMNLNSEMKNYSCQYLTSLVTQLVANEQVIRSTEHGKALFAIA